MADYSPIMILNVTNGIEPSDEGIRILDKTAGEIYAAAEQKKIFIKYFDENQPSFLEYSMIRKIENNIDLGYFFYTNKIEAAFYAQSSTEYPVSRGIK